MLDLNHCMSPDPYVGSLAHIMQGTTAKAAVRFLSFDTIKNALADERGKLSASRGIVAGMVAGAVESVTVVTPTERVKTALSVGPAINHTNSY